MDQFCSYCFSYQFHCIRVPFDHSATLHAEIAKECSSCCTVAKHSIFYYCLAGSNSSEEILEVIVAIAVSVRRDKFFVSRWRLPCGMNWWIFFFVFFEDTFLHCFSECANRVTWFLFTRNSAHTNCISADFHRAF